MLTKDLLQTKSAARATIADVARQAGVSEATVSRFLNHREELLTRDIATRVEVAITALAYKPEPDGAGAGAAARASLG